MGCGCVVGGEKDVNIVEGVEGVEGEVGEDGDVGDVSDAREEDEAGRLVLNGTAFRSLILLRNRDKCRRG